MMQRALRRLFALARAASLRLRRLLVVTLLVLVYLLVLPLFALARRLKRLPPGGWRERRDADVAAPERLRSPF